MFQTRTYRYNEASSAGYQLTIHQPVHWRQSASPVGPPKHWFVLFSCLGVLLKKGNLFAACVCLGTAKATAGGPPGNAPAGDVFMSVLPSSISNEGQVRESMC